MVRNLLQNIARDVRFIREEHIDRVPPHYSLKAIVGSTFGALIFGLTFSLKGLLLHVTEHFNENHKWYLLIATLIILTAEITFIGYSRVKNKKARTFGQFWIKRITTYLAVGIIVAIFLIYLYGVDNLVLNDTHLLNTIIALAFPCCIGASIADLLKQY